MPCFFLLQSGSFEITILGYWFKNVLRWGGFAGIFWLSDRLWESESVAVLRAMQCVCSVARCSNKVYQCWDHEGRLFTATLNTQCRLFSLLRATGIASVSLSFSSICLPHSPVLPLRLPNYLSALPPVSYLSLCLSLTVSPSISCLPFFFPDSFASSVSLLFMFASPFVTLPFSLCVQTSVAASDRSSVVASQGYVKYEMRKEVSGWQFASTSRIRHATSWKLSGRGGHTLRVDWEINPYVCS